MMRIKVSKDLVFAGLSVATSIVTVVVDNHKKKKEAEDIAKMVIKEMNQNK